MYMHMCTFTKHVDTCVNACLLTRQTWTTPPTHALKTTSMTPPRPPMTSTQTRRTTHPVPPHRPHPHSCYPRTYYSLDHVTLQHNTTQHTHNTWCSHDVSHDTWCEHDVYMYLKFDFLIFWVWYQKKITWCVHDVYLMWKWWWNDVNMMMIPKKHIFHEKSWKKC